MAEALITYPFTEEGLRSALEALGTTADAVARNLEAMGFKGCRSQESNCPVAHYVLSAVTGARRAGVSCGYVEVWDSVDGDEAPISLAQTDGIEDFVELFDNGRLPGLEVPDASS